MREIKYRTWDKHYEEWATHDQQLSEVNVSATVREPSVLTVGDGKRFELNMYTGLKDKNGTEIFHKDIVDWIDGEFSFRAVVEDGYWQWYLKGVYPIDNFDFADYTDKNQTDLVIVGNIYENPELLEVTE